MELCYVGPHEAVDVVYDDQSYGPVAYEGTIQVPDDVGKSLLTQGPGHWRTASQDKQDKHARRD